MGIDEAMACTHMGPWENGKVCSICRPNTLNDMTGKTDEEILESLNAMASQPVVQIRGFSHFTPFYDHVIATAPARAAFVEVGVWEGSSLLYLKSHRPDMFVVGVDWGLGQNELGSEMTANTLLRNMKATGWVQEIPILLWDSAKAAQFIPDRSMWGVFIDADHTEAGVERDIRAWYPKVAPGGWLAGDDYNNIGDNWPGVKKAVDRYFPTAFHPGVPDAPPWVEPFTWALQKQ